MYLYIYVSIYACMQALRAFKQCIIVQENGLVALANFTVKTHGGSHEWGVGVGRVTPSWQTRQNDAGTCVSDCVHAMRGGHYEKSASH